MIVLIIMSAMAVMASRSIKAATMNKKKIDARLKTESVVFDALRLISTDVEKAFHYQYALYELERQALVTKAAEDQKNNVNPADIVQPPPPPLRFTQFIGKETSLHFTTLNNQRTNVNAQESDQIEVGYYINSCKSRTTGKSSSCLWRRSSNVIDNDVTRDGEATPLVENVTIFNLEYLSDDPKVKEWKTTWQSDSNGDANTQNMFPLFVRITLETHDKDSKTIGKFGQTVVASVRFPNNTDPVKRFATSPGGPGVTNGPGGPGGPGVTNGPGGPGGPAGVSNNGGSTTDGSNGGGTAGVTGGGVTP